MKRGLLSDYFEGVAVKRLRDVEADPRKSNQHEFNGTDPLKALFGLQDRRNMPARFIRITDEDDAVAEDGGVSWYDSRRNVPSRSAEYRLYYRSNAVSEAMQAGDTLFIAVKRDGSLLIMVTPPDSTIQNQLLWMFGVNHPEFEFKTREITPEQSARLDFTVRYILDEIGIEAEEPEAALLDALIEPFGNTFPATRPFSELARNSLKLDPRDDPDGVLMEWLNREELLFRRLERKIVSTRLNAGFLAEGLADVDGFLAFSLSVQNRRKSRAGQSLENHLAALFTAHQLRFSRTAETENHNRPDFLFPGAAEYLDPRFPEGRLTMLGAKSTCKERWRQVLSEAARIPHKHLLTLEPGISVNQTDEMRAKNLQLVLPARLHRSYTDQQQESLMDVSDFIALVQLRQECVKC